MAKKNAAKKSSGKKKSAKASAQSSAKSAGKPTTGGARRAAAAAGEPSAEDLDIRDRLKSGPRRPAGPPLAGDTPTRAAVEALRDEVIPKATDPKKPKKRS